MDSTDIKILNCLQANARENASVIAEKVSLSVSTVTERIRKLESSGVIQQYTTVLDPKQTGRDVVAFISVGIEHAKYNESFIESIKNITSIAECYYVAGDVDFLLKVTTNSTKSVEKILFDIKNISGVVRTRTMIVFSTLKMDHSVPPKKL